MATSSPQSTGRQLRQGGRAGRAVRFRVHSYAGRCATRQKSHGERQTPPGSTVQHFCGGMSTHRSKSKFQATTLHQLCHRPLIVRRTVSSPHHRSSGDTRPLGTIKLAWDLSASAVGMLRDKMDSLELRASEQGCSADAGEHEADVVSRRSDGDGSRMCCARHLVNRLSCQVAGDYTFATPSNAAIDRRLMRVILWQSSAAMSSCTTAPPAAPDLPHKGLAGCRRCLHDGNGGQPTSRREHRSKKSISCTS